MNNRSLPRKSDISIQSLSHTPIKQIIPVGLFSKQHSLVNSILSTKIKEVKDQQHKHKYSEPLEITSIRTDTPVSPKKHVCFKNKYLLNSVPVFSKKDNEKNLTSQHRFSQLLKQNKSAELDNLSSRIIKNEQTDIDKIINNIQCISQQMNQIKLNSLNQQILSSWQKILSNNCEKIIEIQKRKSEESTPVLKQLDSPQQETKQSVIVLEKLLAEEKRNRLLVEEQTSRIIQSQEAEIKSYISKIEQLEQRLLHKMIN